MPNLKIFYFHDDVKKFVFDLDDVMSFAFLDGNIFDSFIH